MLDPKRILEVAQQAIEAYVENYNTQNDTMVTVLSGDDAGVASDHDVIVIDGGYTNGAWTLTLEEF